MYCDDRLATVLRASVLGEVAANTQYRQLLDLLGSLPERARGPMVEDGFDRLEELAPAIPASRRAALIRDPGLRLANPQLVATLAEDEPEVASAAIAGARLDDAQWLALIPALPVRARGFLRHRRDLGPEVMELLARLGVGDLVLTAPVGRAVEIANSAPPSSSAATSALRDSDEIGALLRRIEAFQQARGKPGARRDGQTDAPRLPLGEQAEAPPSPLPRAFDFATDGAGRIAWANPAVAPMVVGITLAGSQPPAAAEADPATIARMQRHLPVEGGKLVLSGAPAIEGDWRIDAVPRFASPGGRFTGYCGRLRRPSAIPAPANDGESARMREMLHELRTPVNAIQGFAEIIQQQLFGPTPHEYRALAASIAADAAKLLAGFEELDRLARLETGALELDEGSCDFTAQIGATARQLEPYLQGRSAQLSLAADQPSARVPLAGDDAERLAWRLLATLASAAMPGENLAIAFAADGQTAQFSFTLPAGMAGRDDLFIATPQPRQQAISAGMFGPGFTLRLARAEAQAAGGNLRHDGPSLILTLPVLTAGAGSHSDSALAASGGARAT